MKDYQLLTNKIIIPTSKFCPKSIECGQFFRYNNDNGVYSVNSADKSCTVYTNDSNTVIETPYTDYFIKFFALDFNLDAVLNELKSFEELNLPIQYSQGLRIFNQPLFETIISFIISANNNIKRIRQIISRLCINNAFMEPLQIANLSIEQLRSIGCGYRAEYIKETARILSNTDMLIRIQNADSTFALELLKGLKGVGQKVADCIGLFALNHYELCPVDTWIYKIQARHNESVLNLRKRLMNRYGRFAGYAQQYLFNYYAIQKQAALS